MSNEQAAGRRRIAYILKRFPRLSETFIANEILSLAKKGFDIRIFSIKDPGDPLHPFVHELMRSVSYLPEISKRNFLSFLSAHLHSLARRPSGYVRCLVYAWKNRSKESRRKFILAGYISSVIFSEDIRHIHSHFATGSTRLAKYVHLMTGVPFSFTAHAKDIYSDRVSGKQLRRRMRLASFVITISEYNSRYLKTIEPSTRIHVIRNGIRISDFSPNGRGHRGGDRPVILSVGRLVEKKGFKCLVNACAALKRAGIDFQCIIVGDGPLKSSIEAQIRALDLTECVSLEGSKTQDELLKNYYQRADVFVLPCTVAGNNDRDGIPVVLEEAMALGIPVITSEISGIPELVHHLETGMLTPPGDAAALSNSIQTLLADEALREKLTEAARKLIETEYDVEKTSQHLANMFIGALRDE